MATGSTELLVPSYEGRLDRDWELALSEGSRFFEEKSAVQDSLRKVARRLTDLGVPYAVAGGMALFRHGFRRFTEDVNILVTKEGLTRIHEKLEGLGYLPPFEKSKNLRDTEHGVRYLGLSTLVELKLASGMTGGVMRMKDFADVVALIQALDLPSDFAETLNPYVRDRYAELWTGVHENPNEV